MKENKYYQDKNYFGEPYTELKEFFRNYEPKGTVLDLGCGQGRDAVCLAQLGYKVIGIDQSVIAIQQLNNKAEKQDLDITAKLGDVYDYHITSNIDIVLLDSMLYFTEGKVRQDRKLVTKILSELKTEGVFCNCMLQEQRRESIFKDIIYQSRYKWEVLVDDYVRYPEANAKYHMFVVKKKE